MFIHWSVLSSGLLWMRPVIRVLRPDISCLSSRTVCGSCSNGIFSVEGIALLFLMFNNGFFFVRTEKVCRDSVVESRHKYLWIFRACSWTPIGVYVVFLFFFAELFFQQADALSQFFYGWELVLNLFDFYVVVRGNAHWGCDAVECILDFCLVFVAADQ